MATYYMWTGSGVTARANSTAYSAGARIVIAQGDVAGNYLVARRWVWECTTGGTSGAAVPAWPATVTADVTTLTDGTVTWTARTPGYSSGSTVNWTFATPYLAYAARAASANGDVILVHYTSQEDGNAPGTISFLANVNVITVNKDSNNTPTPMDTNGWIGNGTSTKTMTINGGFKVYMYGITVRTATSTSHTWTFFNSTGGHYELEEFFMWLPPGVNNFTIGPTSAANAYVRMVNSTIRYGNTSTANTPRLGYASFEFEGCDVSSSGSVPNVFLFSSAGSTNVKFTGCDLSHVTTTLVGDMAVTARRFEFSQCKLGANVTVLAAQTYLTKSSASVYLFDCSSADTHGIFGYYDAFGSCVSDTGIYYTSGSAGQSWKIVTTANCSYYTPFVSPFIDFYSNNLVNNSITPYFEILRDGSATAYQDDEVWAEFFVKTTSGSTQSSIYRDRMNLLGTPANILSGSGIEYWTGENATSWSGKIDSISPITIAEIGHIRGRVVVGEPSITVYVDPQIRT